VRKKLNPLHHGWIFNRQYLPFCHFFSFLFHLPNTATAAFLTFAECNFAIDFLFSRKESNLIQITSYPFSAQRKTAMS